MGGPLKGRNVHRMPRGACLFATGIAVLVCGCATPPTEEHRAHEAGAIDRPAESPEKSARAADAPTRPVIELRTFDTPSPGPADTPRGTYEAARECIKRADYRGAWALFSSAAKGEADGALPPALGEWRHFQPDRFRQLFGMDAYQFEAMPIWKQWALLSLQIHMEHPDGPGPFTGSTFVSSTIDSGTATVTYRTPDGNDTEMRMVLQDGVWLLAHPRF